MEKSKKIKIIEILCVVFLFLALGITYLISTVNETIAIIVFVAVLVLMLPVAFIIEHKKKIANNEDMALKNEKLKNEMLSDLEYRRYEDNVFEVMYSLLTNQYPEIVELCDKTNLEIDFDYSKNEYYEVCIVRKVSKAKDYYYLSVYYEDKGSILLNSEEEVLTSDKSINEMIDIIIKDINGYINR